MRLDQARRAMLITTLVLFFAACGDGGGGVSFAEPEDGATVSSPVRVVMQSEEIRIEEAGEVREGAGHFHIMVDVECVEPGQTIPEDDQHLHFGDASTEASIDLDPGEHTLCLQVGNGQHAALDATDEITITVG